MGHRTQRLARRLITPSGSRPRRLRRPFSVLADLLTSRLQTRGATPSPSCPALERVGHRTERSARKLRLPLGRDLQASLRRTSTTTCTRIWPSPTKLTAPCQF